MWADSNGAYTETEARTILPDLAPYGIAFLEEPCTFTDPLRMAAVAADLPIALLGDQTCTTIDAVHHLVKINAVGAVSVKLRRTGISDSLKIIALAEAAGLPRGHRHRLRVPHRIAGAHPPARRHPQPGALAHGNPTFSRSWVTTRSLATLTSATAASWPPTPRVSGQPSTGRRPRSTAPELARYTSATRSLYLSSARG